MPGDVDHLFVYGTLLRASDNTFARLLAEHAHLLGEGRLAGLLYDFDRYPGAVKTKRPAQWVYGEVHRLDDQGVLPQLDEYEGPDFKRSVAPVHTREQTIDCWIYWYVGATTGSLIASGDWLKR